MFGIGNSKSTTDASTKIETTNQQATASEGSIAIGAGAQVNMQTVAPEIVNRSLDSVDLMAEGSERVSRAAMETVQTANRDSLIFAGVASGLVKSTSDNALAIVNSNTQNSLDKVSSALGQANQILSKSFEQSVAAVQRTHGVDTSTLASESQKYLLYGGIGLFVVVGILVINVTAKKKMV